MKYTLSKLLSIFAFVWLLGKACSLLIFIYDMLVSDNWTYPVCITAQVLYYNSFPIVWTFNSMFTKYCIYYCMSVLHVFKLLNFTKKEKLIRKLLYYAELS